MSRISIVYFDARFQNREPHNDNFDQQRPPRQIARMRVVEVIIDGFKSYAVRTVISGWDEVRFYIKRRSRSTSNPSPSSPSILSLDSTVAENRIFLTQYALC